MRIAIFADVANLFYCINKKYKENKLDYHYYYEYALENIGEITRAFAYGFQKDNEAKNFITCLRKIGFEAKFKKPRLMGSGENQFVKAEWSIGLCMDVMRVIDKVDIVLLGSSDPEFVPLLEYLKSKGVQTIIYSALINKDLKAIADSYIEIDRNWLEKKNE